jgi:hypothetical protein
MFRFSIAKNYVIAKALYPWLLPFHTKLDYFGSTDYIISRQKRESGARGSITAFARPLVSEPFPTLIYI